MVRAQTLALWSARSARHPPGWTDDRNTVPRTDVREAADDDPTRAPTFLQCRDVLPDGSVRGTSAPRNGGLDQDINGDVGP